MSRSSINILAEEYAKAMASTRGGRAQQYRRTFTRIINFYEIDTAFDALTDAATALESIGYHSQAALLLDQADQLIDQRYDDEVVNAPLSGKSALKAWTSSP